MANRPITQAFFSSSLVLLILDYADKGRDKNKQEAPLELRVQGTRTRLYFAASSVAYRK